MLVHKKRQTIVVIEMTEEQAILLPIALINAMAIIADGVPVFNKEEAEVMNDLRLSLLNS